MSTNEHSDTDFGDLSTREIAETACVLYAVRGGCTRPDLAKRLGLADAQVAAINRVVDDLVERGLATLTSDRVRATPAGKTFVRTAIAGADAAEPQ